MQDKTREHWAPVVVSAIFLAAILLMGDARGQTSQPEKAPARQPDPPAAFPRPIAFGDTVTVDAQLGGFSSESHSTAGIELSWPAVAKAHAYLVLRSDQPKIQVAWSPVIHAQCDANHFADVDKVERGATYYYAIVALMEDNALLLVAAGKASSLEEDGPIVGEPVEEPTTNPSK